VQENIWPRRFPKSIMTNHLTGGTLLRESIIIPGLCSACPSQCWALCAVISLAEGSVCVASAFAPTVLGSCGIAAVLRNDRRVRDAL
jgi:hypothetical protein